MESWSKKQLAAAGVLLIGFAGYIVVQFFQLGRRAEQDFVIVGQTQPAVAASASVQPPSDHAGKNRSALPPAALTPAAPVKSVVHVAGAVKKPGVYHLDADSRVEDAIKAAGGPGADADADSMNLAARVEDGSRIYVPTHKESAAAPPVSETAGKPAGHGSKGGKSGAKFSQPGKESVNINSASLEQLQQLPGVGPAMAAKIIAHRKETGRFSEPEQLMDVSGIGEKKFAKMKPFVRVR